MAEDEVLAAARDYSAGGVSCVPIRVDGSKAPALAAWKDYQARRPTAEEITRWWQGRDLGIAIIGGIVSGGLEILDVESLEAWNHWRSLAVPMLREAGCDVPRLPVVETPGGGRHLFYRHTGERQGNRKLTRWRGTQGEVRCVIETRGEGGYVVAPPSPGACHPTGRPYQVLRGDLAAIPTISGEARDLIVEAALSLSEVMEPAAVVAPRTRSADGQRPGDLYNSRAEWLGLLRRHGWHLVRSRGETSYWRRPGKDHGISASTNHEGTGYLYVWSSNALPFEAERAYSLFGAYGLLDHGGDYHAAAAALAAQGYSVPAPAAGRPEAHGIGGNRLDDLVRRRIMAGSVR